MIHNEIHLISPGCPRPSIALQMQNRGLKRHSFINVDAWECENLKRSQVQSSLNKNSVTPYVKSPNMIFNTQWPAGDYRLSYAFLIFFTLLFSYINNLLNSIKRWTKTSLFNFISYRILYLDKGICLPPIFSIFEACTSR